MMLRSRYNDVIITLWSCYDNVMTYPHIHCRVFTSSLLPRTSQSFFSAERSLPFIPLRVDIANIQQHESSTPQPNRGVTCARDPESHREKAYKKASKTDPPTETCEQDQGKQQTSAPRLPAARLLTRYSRI